MRKNVMVRTLQSRRKTEGKSIIVVLGMHRSGTSAITRGLMVLGVELGNHLIPPAPNNETGFFEDVEVNAINVELYESLGHGQNWHTLAFVPRDELLHKKNALLRLRAIELLRSRLQTTDCFGLKDPRICRILPFWQNVFEYLQLKVSYIIAVRNPLSVARSLRKRHNFPPEKCHYLWLEHILPSMLLTQGAPRALVDYDLLLEDPHGQITRIAHTLGLGDKLDPTRLIEFSQNFLDDRLRHASFETEDVYQDPLVPSPVKKAVTMFSDVAANRLSLESEDVAQFFGSLSEQMEGMSQAMNYLFQLDNLLAGRDKYISVLNESIAENEARLTALIQAAHDREAHIQSLDQVIAGYDCRIGTLMQAMEEREAQLVLLNQMVHDKDAHIHSLEQAATERDSRIEALTQATIQKDITLQHLQVSTLQLSHRLKQTRTSFGWKFFKPVRIIGNSLTRFSQQLAVDLVPLSQLQHNGVEWLSAGNDSRFLLMAKRPWHTFTGWYWLDADMVAGQSLEARLHFDTGTGFDPAQVMNFLLTGKGLQQIPLFISSKCRAIRLDLCNKPVKFRLALRLNRLKQAPELPEGFLAQSTIYEALGGREGNVCLEPMNDVQRYVQVCGQADYCWHSQGADPSFKLEDNGKKLRPGWHKIELRIRLNTDRGCAVLYIDYGKGYSECATVILPFSNGQTVTRLFYLPAIPRQIRFDPIEAAAKFSIERFHLIPVAPALARQQMLQYLCSHYTRHKGQSTDYVWQDLRALAKQRGIPAGDLLYQRYSESFSAKRLQNAISYAEWIDRFETPIFSDLLGIERVRKSFTHEPVISVILPIYNTEEAFLRRAIESVLAQSYPHWELCIADDASSRSYVRQVLEEYTLLDRRIKLVFRSENGHISAASNSALMLATGEYVALMDHDDELAKHALLFMVEAINQNPSAQILYSDEDKIDEQGTRSEPHFKPDWNPDLFFSQNYISHLGIYRRELLQHIEGFRVGVEGSQDQDLLLRCIPHVAPSDIVHIPKVLYHWRMVKGSTAFSPEEKSYTTEAGIKALRDFFSMLGQNDIKVEAGLVPNTYRVRYPVPQPEPLVSLLIPTRDMLEVLEPCIRSILEKTIYQNYEIIILDNESVQSVTLDYFKHIQTEDARVRVLSYPHPFNFSAINNYGVRYARGEVIGLVNNDIEIINGEWLTEMVSHALRPEIGCVGAKLYYADNTIQHAGVILGIGGVANHSHKNFPKMAHGYFARLSVVQNYSAVTAACLLIRKAIYDEVGGLEDQYLKVAFNDIDFCLKVRESGYRNLWTPYAELYHYESKSRGEEDTPEKQVRFNSEVEFMLSRWGENLSSDPNYNPNFTRQNTDFSICS